MVVLVVVVVAATAAEHVARAVVVSRGTSVIVGSMMVDLVMGHQMGSCFAAGVVIAGSACTAVAELEADRKDCYPGSGLAAWP